MEAHEHMMPLGRIIRRYVIGFVTALVLTVGAFSLVMNHVLTGGGLIAVLVVLALIQLGVQLVFFLHLGQEAKPRWQLTAFLFTVVMVSVIVAGSLWIMYHMNYNMMMTPQQMDAYMKKQADSGF